MKDKKLTELLKLPLISFIVTSFNYANFVVRTLNSIKNQTYENIEIIVVDDKSGDDSVKVIQEFISQNKDLRINLIEHEANLGQMAAIQTGLRNAAGQFVCFIDSDDILIKDYAKTLLRVHLESSVAFVSAQIIEIGENDEIHTTYSISSFQKKKNAQLKSLDELLKINVDNVDFRIINLKEAPFGGWYWSAMSANMFRKSALDLFLLYDTPQNWRICPDKFILNFAHLIGDSALVYAPLVGYRRHNNNAGESSQVCGSTRYHSQYTTDLNIRNNKMIRKDTLKFIKKYKKEFIASLGKRGFSRIIWQIRLSYFRINPKKVLSCILNFNKS